LNTTKDTGLKRTSAKAGLSLFLAIVSLLFLAPLLYIFLNSFKQPNEIFQSGAKILPQNWTIANYGESFKGSFGTFFANSAVITVVGVLIVVVVSSLAGYGFAKLKFPGSSLVFSSIIATLTIPLVILLTPLFIMENSLGLLNTRLGLILPNVAVCLPFCILIMHANFAGIPRDIEESAEVDGASRWRRFLIIMLPLTKNGLILVTVYSTYTIWGEYMFAKALALNPPAMPLTVGLTLLKGEVWQYGVLAAVITIAVLPPTIIFIVFQRYIVQGVAQGAIKG